MSPDEFYTPTPFASLSKDDLNYDKTGGYWLGSAWHPTNFVAVRGLYENGYKKEAREASQRFLDVMQKTGGIWECYSPEENKPATRENGTTVRENFVGWGGLFPITVFIENIIGLHFDSEQKTVTFDIQHGIKSGINNMHFCKGLLSIVYDGVDSIMVSTDVPFTLKLSNKSTVLSKGTHTVKI